MIATPTKTDSKNFSSSNNEINFDISDNKIITDYSIPELQSQYNIIHQNQNQIENSKNISQIHTAIISDNLEELENLLKLGENPDVIDKSGETPLYLSVDIENYDAMIILLEFGADCNIQKNDGNTPLHLATEKKNDIYICALLSHGANPNIINKINLQTPLHIGIINKINEYVLNKFKENNGDIYNIKDKFNKTPFDYAKNDEKYENLLISIFSEQNKLNNNKNKCLTENSSNENNSNLDYNNFISLSRKIHLTKEENNELNNNINQNKDKENNNINDINNCLKKHLIFSSNSKEISTEEKNKKLRKSEGSKISMGEQEKSSQSGTNKIVNIISDKSSNYSNSYFINKNNINNSNQNIIYNEKIHNSVENNIDFTKKLYFTTIKKENKNDEIKQIYILSSPTDNKAISHSLYLENKISSIKSNNSNKAKHNNTNNIKNIKTFNTNNSNTNGNNSISNISYNKKKEEGISELNPLDMINQMASSNNSNIFSELQINSNNKEEGEISDSKNNIKTEEEFFIDENNKGSNDELNTMKDNISGNFSSNNNDENENDKDKENYTKEENNNDYININININSNEKENKENINLINSLDDSLEYSKTKSYIINDTPGLLSKDKNDQNDFSSNIKINNKEESLNIYNSSTQNNNTNSNMNNKNIERYKNTTSNKSKKDYDIDSEHNISCEKSFNISNISNILPNNKQNNHHHRQLSYHNNRQSSSNKNKSYNNNTTNSNNIYYNTTTNKENKENMQPNENKDNDNIIQTDSEIKNDIDILNNKNIQIKEQKLNNDTVPLYTMVVRQKIYKNKNIVPEISKEQKTKDTTIEDYRTKEKFYDKNSEHIIFLNDNSNFNSNYNDANTINTGFLDLTNNNNQFNTFCSDNNSNKYNSKETNNYSHLFKKALKKKYLIKEFSQNKYNTDSNIENEKRHNFNEIIHPQQISNELIAKLRDWLISCDLLCYYNLLIKNNIYDIESYITNLKNNKINISYKDIEDLGIKKPGHIFRFLLKLQMDIGVLDNKVCSYILNKFNENLLTTIAVNSSINEIKCCGMIICPGGGEFSKNVNYTDIFSFLRVKELSQFKENFIHNGFDQIEFILIQLFSCFAFNKEILNDYLHIYSDVDKINVIRKLYEEKRIISKEIGIDYDEKEVYNILCEQFDKIENFDKEKSNNICNIF